MTDKQILMWAAKWNFAQLVISSSFVIRHGQQEWPIRPAGEIYNAKGLTLLIVFLIGSVSAQNGLYATDKMQVLCTHKQKRHC